MYAWAWAWILPENISDSLKWRLDIIDFTIVDFEMFLNKWFDFLTKGFRDQINLLKFAMVNKMIKNIRFNWFSRALIGQPIKMLGGFWSAPIG